MRIVRVLTAILIALALLPLQALATTALYYTSSPSSWVGHGETELIVPEQGFRFMAFRNFDNGVSFQINNFNTASSPSSMLWWGLDFAAPNNEALHVGSYLGATRFPFQWLSAPGLTFWGNGRADNTLTGKFDVLEATYASNGNILSFAADFVQYDEGFESWWNFGSIRYNSSIPIPEPAPLILLLAAVASAFAARRVRKLR